MAAGGLAADATAQQLFQGVEVFGIDVPRQARHTACRARRPCPPPRPSCRRFASRGPAPGLVGDADVAAGHEEVARRCGCTGSDRGPNTDRRSCSFLPSVAREMNSSPACPSAKARLGRVHVDGPGAGEAGVGERACSARKSSAVSTTSPSKPPRFPLAGDVRRPGQLVVGILARRRS